MRVGVQYQYINRVKVFDSYMAMLCPSYNVRENDEFVPPALRHFPTFLSPRKTNELECFMTNQKSNANTALFIQ